MSILLKGRSFLFRAILPLLAGALVLGVVLFALLTWAAGYADDVSISRQERLVSLVVSQLKTGVAHDQESSTVWDDAVENVQAGNTEWMDSNLGSWMHTYFGHDRAYILGADDQPIFASADENLLAPERFDEIASEAVPLVSSLRNRMRADDGEELAGDVLSPGAADLSTVSGRPVVISVKPIISDTGEITQVPGTEAVHIAVRFLDGDFLHELERDYLFEGLRFSWTIPQASGETAFPLRRASGDILGYLSWTPFRPGTLVLKSVGPTMAVGYLATLALGILLLMILRRRTIKLRDSRVELQHLALHDALTGLPNRIQFVDRLDAAIQALKPAASLAVLYLDLDRFKQVNDSLGHAAGDDLLREFAGRLRNLVRTGDTVARIGGDEFSMVLPDVSQQHDVEALCQRIIDSVRQPFLLQGNQVFVGVSIGVAFAPSDGLGRTDLTRKADIALYHAKSSGRSRFAVFGKDMDEIIQARRTLEHDLRAALGADDQLQVHYQPLFAAKNGKITGVEALVRWRHPDGSWISPEVFIPIAEESGLIEPLGERVLRSACAKATSWPIGSVAVNVSAVELRSPTYAMRVANLLLEVGLAPSKLELEVTESALTDSSGQCEQTVRSLRELGVRIALDDFGTGFSSLSRLQKLQVDRIKIDRSFVNGFGTSNGDEAIVQAIVDLARATGVKTTAEGVETNRQEEILQELGCDELQGFLYSRAVSPEEIDRLLGLSRTELKVESA